MGALFIVRQSHRPFLFVATIIKVGTVGGGGAVCVSSSIHSFVFVPEKTYEHHRKKHVKT